MEAAPLLVISVKQTVDEEAIGARPVMRNAIREACCKRYEGATVDASRTILSVAQIHRMPISLAYAR